MDGGVETSVADGGSGVGGDGDVGAALLRIG